MTVTGFICYAQGWGGLYIRANKLANQMQQANPTLTGKSHPAATASSRKIASTRPACSGRQISRSGM